MLLTTSGRRRSRMTFRDYRLFGAAEVFQQDTNQDKQYFTQLMNNVAERLEPCFLDCFEITELLDSLDRLCKMLEDKFCLEETIGYIVDVKRSAPELSDVAESLVKEHRPLWNQLRHVLKLAESSLRLGDATGRSLETVRDSFAGFRDQFNAHESRESAFVIDLMYSGMGGEGWL